MHFPAHEQKQALLEPVLRLAAQRLSGDAARQARDFIAHYYHHVDAEDLTSRSPEDLYGAAMAHLAFARQFTTGMSKLRVYNPRPEEHGWSSPHTVIEMVNDDMPFLVDSVTMEVNRQGYTLHLLNHPIFAARRDKEGNLDAYAPPSRDEPSESLIHVEIDHEIDPSRLKAIGSGIHAVLADVRASVEDWPAMRERLQAIVKEMQGSPPTSVSSYSR
jgi:glutamate dehydrogenase